MKLESLQIFARGPSGWGSGELKFADSITQIYGPNGSGKTPVVQSIAFCLGNPCKFRKDVYGHCLKAVLTVSIKGDTFKFERPYIEDNFEIIVTEPLGTTQRFYSEGDFSQYLFELLGYDYPQLVTVRDQPTAPFISCLLPLFYLDQSNGYSDFYKSLGNHFIKDQFEEIVRLSANFPVKNSFDKKKSRLNAKHDVQSAHEKVHRIKSVYENALKESQVSYSSIEEIDEQIEIYKTQIENSKSSKNLKVDTTDNIDKLISLKMKEAREIKNEITLLERKSLSVISIKTEIEAEINTLSLNEEAKRVFSSFSEICSTPGCGLFLGSSESYGKNLLYLRDQIKDLEISANHSRVSIDILNEKMNDRLKDIEILSVDRDNVFKDDSLTTLVDSIHAILSEIVELEVQKKELENLVSLEERFISAENYRDEVLNKQDALSSAPSTTSIEITRFKMNLKTSIQKWIELINTKNTSKIISFEHGFKAILGDEKLSVFTGSTKVRIVLAYHAALFEELIKLNSRGIRFLILDTPKQHDIGNEDLDFYIKALKELAAENQIQIIFSTTTYKYEVGENDTNWLATFGGFEQPMFLGYF